ncbi:aspartate aminotransferase, mitochondrial [Spodoptera frugiperda]|uniref:Aspartate aminotransferase n=1 Tax=Spodoptera frugiperda TaxID=7108 RepID=A0A9R0EP19_SPOFR|nr:aspartate aminotransferase, mitochondrial [Spodoptera frugiperda]XP_035446557.2 aspartate aminotransferase, mitochondrial [Spodoptera frugiperda]
MPHVLAKISLQLLAKSNVDFLNIASRAQSNMWSNVPMGPPDVILGVAEAFRKDKSPKKVNLGVGAYRDDNNKPYVLPSVRQAEEIIFKKCLNHEYAPIVGDATYCDLIAKLGLGDNSLAIKEKRNVTIQSISGTGALRVGFEFIAKHYGHAKEIWMPAPTWGNHPQICNTLGIVNKRYRYYDPRTLSFNLKGCCEDICSMPPGSIILLHACAHNPTGVDPKPEEWQTLSEIIKEKRILPFFDMAYQGFATGSVDNDAFAVRLFEKHGHQIILAQSFAKNMGLYGERVGGLTIVCADTDTAAKVMSQMKILIRTLYSNPSINGSRIVTEILSNPDLKAQWLADVKEMADRIILMRKKLREGIEKRGNKHKWNHITDQIGMFCYTGLKPEQVERLTKEFHIYLTKDGRISVAGICSSNVDYVAECIHKVTADAKPRA